MDQDVGDGRRARRPHLVTRCGIAGRQVLEFSSTRRGGQQGLEFLSPSLEGSSSASSFIPFERRGTGQEKNPRAHRLAARAREQTGGLAATFPRKASPVAAATPMLLAVADSCAHPPLLPPHLAPSFAFSHPMNLPFRNERSCPRQRSATAVGGSAAAQSSSPSGGKLRLRCFKLFPGTEQEKRSSYPTCTPRRRPNGVQHR